MTYSMPTGPLIDSLFEQTRLMRNENWEANWSGEMAITLTDAEWSQFESELRANGIGEYQGFTTMWGIAIRPSTDVQRLERVGTGRVRGPLDGG